MAYTANVTTAVGVAGVCTLTLDVADLDDYFVGDKVRVNGINNNFNGVHTLTALNTTLFTVTFSKGNVTQTLTGLRGAEIEVLPQWTSSAEVLVWLGIDVATANDTAFIEDSVDASNEYCWRKRQEAGYTTDRTSFPPSADVVMGATMYAATLYRERGSVDSFASFDTMGVTTPVASLGRIMQLLGCGRAQVA
jgi:hypothetical protein